MWRPDREMLNFAANLSWMFQEWPFLDRFAAAADTGFKAVEFLFPYEHKPEDIAARLSRHGLILALFNLPPGNFAVGERGMACLPDRQAEFRASVEIALAYARTLGVSRLHMMSGNGAGDADGYGLGTLREIQRDIALLALAESVARN